MTPEEKFNQDVWWILREIRNDEFLTPKGEKVEFRIRVQPKISSRAKQTNTLNFPAEDTQRKLLYKLKEWQAIDLEPASEIFDHDIFNPPKRFLLTIHEAKFSELYHKYEGGISYQESEKEKPHASQHINTENGEKTKSQPNSQIANRAEKKKLCVLEKLKEEHDLTPKTAVRTHVYFGYSHVRPAGEAWLYGQKLLTWIQECNLNDRLELENILAIFQQEGLVSKFIFSEQEGNLKIQFPEDFEEWYEKYKAKILGVEKTAQKEVAVAVETQQQDDRPYCEIKEKLGFLKFNKWSKGRKVGFANSQPFRLLQCLTEPFGVAKAIDTVFEAIRENVKYKSKSGVYESGVDKKQKIKLIEYAIKELQKENKLQGKLVFKWNNIKTKIWLECL